MKLKDMIQAAVCWMALAFSISMIISLVVLWGRFNQLNTHVAVYKSFSVDTNNVVIDLNDLLVNQEESIKLNSTDILKNSKRITQNAMDIDNISNEGLNIRIDEIIEDIKELERIVK